LSIRNYSDHAANERTFLAWVRTSIAITAFGFLIERFDLFLDFAARTTETQPLHHSELGPFAGLVLIVAGVVMVALSALRFVKTAREIDREQVIGGAGSRLDIALALLLVLLGIALFLYLYHAVSSQA
jgi:putative membrane protein